MSQGATLGANVKGRGERRLAPARAYVHGWYLKQQSTVIDDIALRTLSHSFWFYVHCIDGVDIMCWLLAIVHH